MYAIRLNGHIKVKDIDTDSILEPVSVVLGTRYATEKDALAAKERVQDANKTNITKTVIEVTA